MSELLATAPDAELAEGGLAELGVTEECELLLSARPNAVATSPLPAGWYARNASLDHTLDFSAGGHL